MRRKLFFQQFGRRKPYFQQFGHRQTFFFIFLLFLSIFHVESDFKLCIISLGGSTEQPTYVKLEIQAI